MLGNLASVLSPVTGILSDVLPGDAPSDLT